MKKNLRAFLLASSLIAATATFAQHQAEQQIYDQSLAANPAAAARLQQLRSAPSPTQPQSVLIVPVVFHVLYQSANQNVADSCLIQQIAVLNEDYRKQNSDTSMAVNIGFGPLIADCEIEFCLATIDPQGNATNGMLHVQTSTSSFNSLSAVAAVSPAWDAAHYLNVWVCNTSNGMLGFSQFPGVGPASTDGIVIYYRAIGKTCALAPFNLGRTLTHEIGHWFGLTHVAGDPQCTDTDGISDTPTMASSGPYTCCGVHTDVCQPNAPGVMYMNFMCVAYNGDNEICLFTPGQKAAMWNVINTTRSSLFGATQAPCAPLFSVSNPVKPWQIDLSPVPSSGIVNINLPLQNKTDFRIRVFDASSRMVFEENVTEFTGGIHPIDLSALRPGVYFVEMKTDLKTGTGKIILQQP